MARNLSSLSYVYMLSERLAIKTIRGEFIYCEITRILQDKRQVTPTYMIKKKKRKIRGKKEKKRKKEEKKEKKGKKGKKRKKSKKREKREKKEQKKENKENYN